jgi:hypothetical protein
MGPAAAQKAGEMMIAGAAVILVGVFVIGFFIGAWIF